MTEERFLINVLYFQKKTARLLERINSLEGQLHAMRVLITDLEEEFDNLTDDILGHMEDKYSRTTDLPF